MSVRRHLVSLSDLSDDDIRWIVSRSQWLAAGHSPGTLSRRIVGIYFRKTSTRTRTAFTAGALRLGGQVVTYGPADLQLATGETVADTTRVLSRMLDVLVARTAGSTQELREFAAQREMAVVNAMSAAEHPTQALADLATMQAVLGRTERLRVLYLGEGNNTAVALALALARCRQVRLELRTPPGYGLDKRVLDRAAATAGSNGGAVTECHDMAGLPRGADIVYTTRWQTTGTQKDDPDWHSVFAPFQVTDGVMALSPEAIFMHDLPAHRGEEVAASVLDGPASVAFRQAEYKLYSAMAVLEWCLGGLDGMP